MDAAVVVSSLRNADRSFPPPCPSSQRRNPLLLLLFLFPEAEPLTKFVINLPGLGNAALRKVGTQ